jgi:hypothetical protein
MHYEYIQALQDMAKGADEEECVTAALGADARDYLGVRPDNSGNINCRG